MNLTNFVLAFAILGQSFRFVLANASEHELSVSASDKSVRSVLDIDGELQRNLKKGKKKPKKKKKKSAPPVGSPVFAPVPAPIPS